MRDLKFLLFIVAVLAVIAIITTVLVPIAKAANIEPRFALLAGTIVTVGIFWKLA